MSKVKKLVYGVGINDADYIVIKREYLEERLPSGKKKQKLVRFCPYYSRWKNMLERCYSLKSQDSFPTYKSCTVCEEWLLFSNFRKWMILQDWKDKHLDKDILFRGNKIYSPETCTFIDPQVNIFTTDRGNARGKYLLGACSSGSKFKVRCCNPFIKGKQSYLGVFNTELEAHLAWKKQKHTYACELADSEYVTDERVAEALRNKYKNYTIYEEDL